MPLHPWKTLSTRVVHATPWIEVIEDTCKVDRRQITYTYTRRVDEGPLIIAQTTDDKLWMVRQYRHPIQKIIWQFPVEGKLSGETWAAAAQRGLDEELKLRATQLVDLGSFYPDPGGLRQRYKVFIATGLTPTTTIAPHSVDEIEDLEIKSFSRREIESLVDTGDVCDNWTLSALFLYDRYRK